MVTQSGHDVPDLRLLERLPETVLVELSRPYDIPRSYRPLLRLRACYLRIHCPAVHLWHHQ